MSFVKEIAFSVKPFRMKSLKWKVVFGRSVHIDATRQPWRVFVSARPTRNNPNPKRRIVYGKERRKILDSFP